MSLTQLWLGIGSNSEQVLHINSALEALSLVVQDIKCSPIFESESVGIKSNNFYNLVLTGKTSLPIKELSKLLKEIEVNNGRYDKVSKLLPLDIDLLLYGNEVGQFEHVKLPHGGILANAYVLLPLSLLSPFNRHPSLGITFHELWQNLRTEINQKLWLIDTPWLLNKN